MQYYKESVYKYITMKNGSRYRNPITACVPVFITVEFVAVYKAPLYDTINIAENMEA